MSAGSAKVSQMDGPRPPSLVAPSIWKAEVVTPQRKSWGKTDFSTGGPPFAAKRENFSYDSRSLDRREAFRHAKVAVQSARRSTTCRTLRRPLRYAGNP